MDTLSPETLKAINDLTALGVLALISIGIIGLTIMIVRGNTNATNKQSDETKVLLQLVADLITALKGLDVTLQTVRQSGQEGTAVMETQAVVLSSIRDTLVTLEKSMRDHNIAVTETIGTLAANVGDLESMLKKRTDEIIGMLKRLPVDVADGVNQHISAMLIKTVTAAPKEITGEIAKAIIAEATEAPPATNNTGGDG